MNYLKIYESLIESRKTLGRLKKEGLYEKHHILPRSLGGSNIKSNLILLTPREHYLAHWLLYKMHSGHSKSKMAYAFYRMCSNNPNQKRVITSSQYGRAKDSISKSCTGENHPNFGKNPWNEEQIEAIRKRQTGSGNSMYGKIPWNKKHEKVIRDPHRPKSESHKLKLSQSLKGRSLSEDIKLKMSLSRKGKPHMIIVCDRCGKEGGEPAMRRWHFENCKSFK